MRVSTCSSLSILLLFGLLSTGTAGAESDSYERLARAKSLKCTFGVGAVGDWRTGTLKVVSDTFGGSIHFDSIDIKANSARMIGNIGAGDITVLLTPIGLTFIDTQESLQTVAVTTVFGKHKDNNGDYIAVTSRHLASLAPTPSQYHGTCKVWQ